MLLQVRGEWAGGVYVPGPSGAPGQWSFRHRGRQLPCTSQVAGLHPPCCSEVVAPCQPQLWPGRLLTTRTPGASSIS